MATDNTSQNQNDSSKNKKTVLSPCPQLLSAHATLTTTVPLENSLSCARIKGEPLTKLPQDLYIPPEALQVFLETFEGPLDLLLYLIKQNNLDILEISLTQITEQYLKYIDLMEDMRFELAAEYLVMAATLAEIKSRMLLPQRPSDEDEEEDPRVTLIQRLKEYERFKIAAEKLDVLARLEREFRPVCVHLPRTSAAERVYPTLTFADLMEGLKTLLREKKPLAHHHISQELLSTRERMGDILTRLQASGFIPFIQLINSEEGRLGIIVNFLAIMELVKESLVELIQTDYFGPIHIKARTPDDGT